MLIAILLTLSLTRPAAALEPSSHGSEWRQIIDPLIQTGLRRVGRFDLVAFRARASRVQWWRLEGAPTSEESGSRQSAYYDRGRLAVYLREDLPASERASLPALTLHEAIGATGFANDDDYQLSTALQTLARMPAGDERDALAARYASSLFGGAPLRVARGGTSVSGGGDLSAVAVKQAVLQRLAGSAGGLTASQAFLAFYPRIAFEPLRQGTGAAVTLKYNLSLRPRVRETLSVFLPMRTWNRGAEAEARLIEDAALKISQIFPARAGSVRTFTPSACARSGRQISFPATNDEQVAVVQDYRGGLLLGCQENDPDLDERGVITAPSPSESSDEPRQANMNYFACELRYGGAVRSTTFRVARGQHALESLDWSGAVERGDFLNGDLAVSVRGDIEWAAISYATPSGVHLPYTPRKSRDGRTGANELSVNGGVLTFRCEKKNRE